MKNKYDIKTKLSVPVKEFNIKNDMGWWERIQHKHVWEETTRVNTKEYLRKGGAVVSGVIIVSECTGCYKAKAEFVSGQDRVPIEVNYFKESILSPKDIMVLGYTSCTMLIGKKQTIK